MRVYFNSPQVLKTIRPCPRSSCSRLAGGSTRFGPQSPGNTTHERKDRGTRGPVRAVMFDFDGPVCDVFSGHPASEVAARMLRATESLDPQFRQKSRRPEDPIELLREVVAYDYGLLTKAEDILRCGERIAVHTSRPTEFAKEAIVAASANNRPVAIISNNSEDAIHFYLSHHNLDRYVTIVIGRPYAQPDRMKPNPEALLLAARDLGIAPSEGVFIGDSVTDIEAARTVAMPCIGYAKRPERRRELQAAGASLVVDSMNDVAHVLNPNATTNHPA